MSASEEQPSAFPWRRWLLPGLLALVPFAVLVVKTGQYGLCFPYWDEWHLTPLVEKAFAGQWHFKDFWAQHNEHRLIFPRLVMVILARLTHWNGAWEVAANIAAGIGIFAASLALMRRNGRILGNALSPWLAVVLAFFIFSWGQMENWVWPWQIQIFLSTGAVMAGTACLAGETSWKSLFAAAACALVATYSFANGLLFWIAALPLVVAAPGIARRTRFFRAEAWIAFAIVTFQSYFFDYQKPAVNPSISAAFEAPLAFVGYVCVYLGGPLTALAGRPAWHGAERPLTLAHFVPGMVGLLFLAVLLVRIAQKHRAQSVAFLPWLTLIAYAGGSAVVTAAGRVGFGLEQALMSRYMTVAVLFWCGVAGLVAALGACEGWGARRPVRRYLAAAAVALLICAGTARFVQTNAFWEDRCRWHQMSWRAVLAGDDFPLHLQDLCWDPTLLASRYLPAVRRLKLCGFDRPRPLTDGEIDRFFEEAQVLMAQDRVPAALTYLQSVLRANPEHAEARQLHERGVERLRVFQRPRPEQFPPE